MAKKEKEIVVEKAVLEKEHTFFPIEELPVKNTGILPRKNVDGVLAECVRFLVCVHWETVGYVSLYEKESLINAIIDGYKRTTYKEANKAVDSLVSQEIFREEIKNGEKWLIPLKQILECVAPHPKEKGMSSCLIHTYYDVNISLT
jgi:hypothetical protein